MAALLAGFVALWIVLPASSLPTLAIAVLATEESPVCFVAFAVVLALTLVALRGATRVLCATLAACAVVSSLLPLVQLGATIRTCDAALGLRESNRERPFELARAFGIVPAHPPIGIVTGVAVPLRDGTHSALDIYRRGGTGVRPAVILIYGGAWQFGTREQSRPLATFFAERGDVAIAIDYRHAPRYRFPTEFDDVRDALAAIARHARQWGVDPARVAIVGESAGAELGLLAAYTPEPLRVRAVVGIYAPLDFANGYRNPPVPDPADVRALLRTYIGGPPDRFAAAYAAASPRSLVRSGLPATLLIGGDRDELVDIRYQREMARALRAAGDRVTSLEFPWSNHGFVALAGGLGGQLARYYTGRFLSETTQR